MLKLEKDLIKAIENTFQEIRLMPSDSEDSFNFNLCQFPIKPSVAMAIKNVQKQIL